MVTLNELYFNNAFIMPVGVIVPYVDSTPPDGWLICDGSFLDSTVYQNLFALIGYKYGQSGSDFALPDLRDRVPLGVHTNRPDATTGGNDTVTLTSTELPTHNHGVTDPGHTHGRTDPGHAHSVYDPSHTHTISQSGHAHGVGDPGHAHGGYTGGSDNGWTYTTNNPCNTQNSGATAATWTATNHAHGLSTYGAGTGIWIGAANANVSNVANTTGVSIYAANTGATINSNTTGLTTNNTGSGSSFPIKNQYLTMYYIIKH